MSDGALTREDFDRAWREIAERPYVPEYQRAPHHPRCAAVRSQDWRDCDCSTGFWLAQHGYLTHRAAGALQRAFDEHDRRQEALLTHFWMLGGDD